MLSKKEIAINYINFLEKGNITDVLSLFTKNGIVDSPVYGVMNAHQFYNKLNNDTTNSELDLKGIFEEKDSNSLALYFKYKWTLKNNQKVEFDVVDIIEFDTSNKITKLKIIYDTVISRELVKQLES
ncbi:nuclear transport factor 2 family protein [Flavobacteriaceae bacterium AU392]|nr:nuclear transport factor 2 family protein [Flavobacteriaceae bacterium]RKM85924.1 nuclear transport factor 2 family protein [Flavobacteriaceae bacterium AU392]